MDSSEFVVTVACLHNCKEKMQMRIDSTSASLFAYYLEIVLTTICIDLQTRVLKLFGEIFDS